jgi:hypothetical protein
VNAGVEIKFSLMVVPLQEEKLDGPKSKKAEILKSHGQPAILSLSDFTT